MMDKSSLKPILIFACYACIFIIPTLGVFNLFDWDEINFAESTREMMQSNNFFQVQINYEPFHEKPPLFFWIQFISMKLFGVNAFAARFPNALLGFLTPLLLFKIGSNIKNNSFGLIWGITYLVGILPNLYFRTGIIDPYFNIFIFTSIFFYYKALFHNDKNNKYVLLCGLFSGLGLITKGPVALLILVLVAIFYYLFNRAFLKLKQLLIFSVVFVLTSLIWYGYELYNKGVWFIVEFVKYQIELFSEPVAGHEQPIYYHFLVVLFGCFPFSFFALKNSFKNSGSNLKFEGFMRILLWVVLILFTIVSTKIIHYSSLAYFPLSFLASIELYKLSQGKQISRVLKVSIISFGALISSFISILAYFVIYNKDFLIEIIDDNNVHIMLNQNINWHGWEWLIPLFLLVGSLVWLLKENIKVVYKLVFFMIMLGSFFSLSAYFIVPKAEQMTQGSAIRFYESISKEKKYLTTVGYKSYAHYFYGEIDELSSKDKLYNEKKRILKTVFNTTTLNDLTVAEKVTFNSRVVDWLVDGEVDRTVYFATKINRPIKQLKKSSNLKKIKSEGGFVFYKREIK